MGDKLIYEFKENFIVVTIPFNWINVMSDKNTKSFLNHTKLRILAEIRNNTNITKPRLAEILKLGKTTIDKGIAVLKKYGHIERIEIYYPNQAMGQEFFAYPIFSLIAIS